MPSESGPPDPRTSIQVEMLYGPRRDALGRRSARLRVELQDRRPRRAEVEEHDVPGCRGPVPVDGADAQVVALLLLHEADRGAGHDGARGIGRDDEAREAADAGASSASAVTLTSTLPPAGTVTDSCERSKSSGSVRAQVEDDRRTTVVRVRDRLRHRSVAVVRPLVEAEEGRARGVHGREGRGDVEPAGADLVRRRPGKRLRRRHQGVLEPPRRTRRGARRPGSPPRRRRAAWPSRCRPSAGTCPRRTAAAASAPP